MRNLIAVAFLLLASSAEAQNPQCPTRPAGDNTNACASTAFVQNSISTGLFGNPTVPGVNLVGSNGTAITSMRSDAVLALDQAISPTWTSTHTFSNSVSIFGSPSLLVPLIYNPYVLLPNYTSLLAFSSATKATSPEIGIQSIVTSAVGGGVPAGAFKIAGFFASTGSAGTADLYGVTGLCDLGASVSSSIQCLAIEGDLNVRNAHYGDTAGSPTHPYTTNLYLASGGDHRATAAMMIAFETATGDAGYNRGIVMFGGKARLNSIEDYLEAGSSYFMAGSYQYGVNMVNSTIVLGAMYMPNSSYLVWRNGANTDAIAAITLDGSNNILIATNTFIRTTTQFTGFQVNNGTNTVVSAIGLSVTNDGGDFRLLNGGVAQIRFSANASIPSYIDNDTGLTVGGTSSAGAGNVNVSVGYKVGSVAGIANCTVVTAAATITIKGGIITAFTGC